MGFAEDEGAMGFPDATEVRTRRRLIDLVLSSALNALQNGRRFSWLSATLESASLSGRICFPTAQRDRADGTSLFVLEQGVERMISCVWKNGGELCVDFAMLMRAVL